MNEELISVYFELKEKGYLRVYDTPEYLSLSYAARNSEKYPKGYSSIKKFQFDSNPEIDKEYCKIFGVMVENERNVNVVSNGSIFSIKATVSMNIKPFQQNSFYVSTTPKIGQSIKRKSKAYPNGVKLTKKMLDNSIDYQQFLKDFEQKLEALIRFNTAKFIVEIRKSGLIDKNKLEAVILEKEYYSLPLEDRKQFLIDNGFKGVEENYGVYEEQPDGYGHKTGRTTTIDFEKKVVYVIGFSSDD